MCGQARINCRFSNFFWAENCINSSLTLILRSVCMMDYGGAVLRVLLGNGKVMFVNMVIMEVV